MKVTKKRICGVNITDVKPSKKIDGYKDDLLELCFDYYYKRLENEKKLDKLRYKKTELTAKEDVKFDQLNQKNEDLSHSFGFDVYTYIANLKIACELAKK